MAAAVDQLPPAGHHELRRVHTLIPKALVGDDG
jgi:hypothetical protein